MLLLFVAILCCIMMLCFIMLCYIWFCYAVLLGCYGCCIVLRCFIQCFPNSIMLYRIVLCHVVLHSVLFSSITCYGTTYVIAKVSCPIISYHWLHAIYDKFSVSDILRYIFINNLHTVFNKISYVVLGFICICIYTCICICICAWLGSTTPPTNKTILLGGSFVVVSGVISKVPICITLVRELITPHIATHEPPSREAQTALLRLWVRCRVFGLDDWWIPSLESWWLG